MRKPRFREVKQLAQGRTAKTQASATSLHHAPNLKVKRLRLRRRQRHTHPESVAEWRIQNSNPGFTGTKAYRPKSAPLHPGDSSVSHRGWHFQEVPGGARAPLNPGVGWCHSDLPAPPVAQACPWLPALALPWHRRWAFPRADLSHCDSAPQPRVPSVTSQAALCQPFTLM